MLLLFAFTREGGEYRQSVHGLVAPVGILAQQLYEGRHHVPAGSHQVGNRTRGDGSGPVGNVGYPHAALVQGALQTSESGFGVEEGGVGTTLVVRAVVAGEDKEGLLGDTQLFEFVDDLSYIGVEAGNHGCKLCARFGRCSVVAVTIPGIGLLELTFVHLYDAVLRLAQLGVRNGVGKVAEKGLVLVVLDKLHGMLVNGILRVTSVLVLLGFVVPQVFGIVGVGFALAVVAIEHVEPHVVGFTSRTGITHAPFAETAGHIAVLLEQLSNRFYIGVEGFLTFGLNLLVAPDLGVAGVLAGHQRGSRRSTHGRAGIELGEGHTLADEPVQVGGRDHLLAIGLDVTVSHVVAKQVDDVGAFGSGYGISLLGKAQSRGEEQTAGRIYKFASIHVLGILVFRVCCR